MTRDAAETEERVALVQRLEQSQQTFERRALSAMAEPLISTALTMQQLRVLTLIAIDPARATGHNLAPLLKVSVATVSGLVDRLVDHGMVERAADPADRRVRRLVVTPEGSTAIRELLSASGSVPTPVLDRLALDDLRALVRGVLAVEQAMEDLQAESPTAG